MAQDTASVRLPLARAGWNPATAQSAGVFQQAAGAARPPVESLYIHTPFCVHKCHYCDFYSFVDTQDRQQAFVERLIGELRVLAPHAGPLRTIFVGGGTPSLLRVDLWERLLGALDDLFDLSIIRRPWRPEHSDPWKSVQCGEFTVECNPESTTAELLSVLKRGGVNRVSVGAQSFHEKHLKTLERWHDPANVARAIELAKAAAIERQSVDLIFGIPGQTLGEWDADLQRALALGTTHLSCYALTYEQNTAMTKRLAMGEFEACPEELEAEMFKHTAATLRACGLERYEVSNFAIPGHESRHNIAYWIQEQWLGAGPSASSHVWAGGGMEAGSWRYKNVPRLGDYLDSSDWPPVVDIERPDPLRLVRERIMMGLRLGAGLEARALMDDVRSISPAHAAGLERSARRQIDRGLMTISGTRWTLTNAGMLVCDGVAADLMGSIR